MRSVYDHAVLTRHRADTWIRVPSCVPATAAVWQLPRLAAAEQQTYTITLSQAATTADNLRGAIRWTKPVTKTGPVDAVVIPPAPTPPAVR
jgi:hypothetical protein